MFRSFLFAGVLIVFGFNFSSHPADAAAPLQLPDTTPPGKPHFDSKGAKAGDQLAPLPLRTLGGKNISLEKAWSEGTTLLLTSSYTCPKSRATYPGAAELARRIAGHGIHAAIVYVIEAHPAGDPSPYSGIEEITTENRRDQILCRQPTTMAERLKLANEFATRFKIEIPVFVDAMDNTAWSMLGGGPNMGVLVDNEGVVLARQGWFDAGSMERAMAAFIAAAPKRPAFADIDETTRTTDRILYDCITNNNGAGLAAQLDQHPEYTRRLLYSYVGRSLMQAAAEDNRVDLLKLLVQHGADVNGPKEQLSAPLYQAVERGRVEAVRFLIEHGVDVNAKEGGHGPTALQEAYFSDAPELIGILLKAGAKPNFYTAAATGDLAELRRCSLEDPTLLSRPDGSGRTALTYAAATNHLDSARLLISLGARDFPAENYRDWRGPATWRAIDNKNLDMLRLLLDGDCDPNLLVLAIYRDASVDMIRSILDHKADPSRLEKNGLPPLHAAAGNNRSDIMQLLLDRGADINMKTTGSNMMFCGISFFTGDTAMQVAVKNDHPEAMEFLLKHGAKVNTHNEDGQTPLHDAVAIVNHEPVLAGRMIHALIENHADINAVDTSGQTPLDYAAPRENGGLFEPEEEKAAQARRVIEFLKKQGAVKGKVKAPKTEK